MEISLQNCKNDLKMSLEHLTEMHVWSQLSISHRTAPGWVSDQRVCLMQEVTGSCPGWVIPKTIIKMVQTASLHGTHVLG